MFKLVKRLLIITLTSKCSFAQEINLLISLLMPKPLLLQWISLLLRAASKDSSYQSLLTLSSLNWNLEKHNCLSKKSNSRLNLPLLRRCYWTSSLTQRVIFLKINLSSIPWIRLNSKAPKSKLPWRSPKNFSYLLINREMFTGPLPISAQIFSWLLEI